MEENRAGTEFIPEVYRVAAKEHVGSLLSLYDKGEYVLVIYVAGLAVECMLRAYRTSTNPHFDTRHDLQELARVSGFAAKVPEKLVDPYDADLSMVATRWNNSHRYRSEDALRKYLKRGHFDRGIKGDFLKENARRVLNSATNLVTLGDRLWKK